MFLLEEIAVAKVSLAILSPLLTSCNFWKASLASYTLQLSPSALSTQNLDFTWANFCATSFNLESESVLTETSLLNLPLQSSISSTLSGLIKVIFSKLTDFTLKNAPIADLLVDAVANVLSAWSKVVEIKSYTPNISPALIFWGVDVNDTVNSVSPPVTFSTTKSVSSCL